MLPCIYFKAIHGYRETERKVWSEKNKKIIQRVRDAAFPPGTPQLSYVHVLDLKKEGFIKPHVDAVKVGYANLHFVQSVIY